MSPSRSDAPDDVTVPEPVDGPLRPFYLHAPAVKLPLARVSAS